MSWKNVVFKVSYHHSSGIIHFPASTYPCLLWKTTQEKKLFWYVVWQGHIRWVMPFHQKYFVWWWKLNFSFLTCWKIIGCLFTLSFDKYTGVKFIQIETIYLFYVHFKYTSQIEVNSKWYLQWIEYSEYQL